MLEDFINYFFSSLNLTVVNRASTPENDESEKLDLYQSTVLKIFVDYAQGLGILSSIKIAWPSGVDIHLYSHNNYKLGHFKSVLSKGVPSNEDVFSIDCFISLGKKIRYSIYIF